MIVVYLLMGRSVPELRLRFQSTSDPTTMYSTDARFKVTLSPDQLGPKLSLITCLFSSNARFHRGSGALLSHTDLYWALNHLVRILS